MQNIRPLRGTSLYRRTKRYESTFQVIEIRLDFFYLIYKLIYTKHSKHFVAIKISISFDIFGSTNVHSVHPALSHVTLISLSLFVKGILGCYLMFITVIYSNFRPAIGAVEIQQRIVFQPLSRVFDQYFI